MHDDDNLTIERPTFVTHLECAMEGDHYAADQVHNLSKAGKPLLVRYDLAGVKKALSGSALAWTGRAAAHYQELREQYLRGSRVVAGHSEDPPGRGERPLGMDAQRNGPMDAERSEAH